MQNKHANCASPQLLCPRPTVPHAQNSPQFAWSEWPNEAPVNAYQVHSESSGRGYTGSNLHSPQAHETPYSYENQQVRYIRSCLQPLQHPDMIHSPRLTFIPLARSSQRQPLTKIRRRAITGTSSNHSSSQCHRSSEI